MTPHRYREQNLSDAASAAGAAFGVAADDPTLDEARQRPDVRALLAIAVGIGILATITGYLLI